MNISTNVSVLAVQNYGPSGTLLLQSLLDGHPNILSFPTVYIHNFFYFWDKHGDESTDSLINSFIDEYNFWFHPEGAVKALGLHQMGENMDETIYVSEEIFKNTLSHIVGRDEHPSRKSFFIAIYFSYAKALGRKIDEPVVLVFPIHNLPRLHAKYLIEDFPNAKFVHMIREPIQLIVSSFKHVTQNYLPANPAECAYSQMLNDYIKQWGWPNKRFVYGYKPYFNEHERFSKAVKLEDIHTNPEIVLKTICEWLDIPWHKCLLTSTFNGKKWWNRPGCPRISGFGLQAIKKKTDDVISEFDKYRLYGLMSKKYKIWGYQYPELCSNIFFQMALPFLILIPFKAEGSFLKYRFIYTPIGLYKQIIVAMTKRLKKNQLPLGIGNIIHFAGKFFDSINVIFEPASKSSLWHYLKKFMVIMGFTLFVPVFLLILLKDTLMVRYWLYRGWFVNLPKKRSEVRLLYDDVLKINIQEK
ncbi:MAG: sulfotransferase [Deltaproteobacteria bacterium]|nr:sulfotransferase [Deltaproteobacteria bacterium]